MGTSPATGQAARRRLLTQPLNSAADDGRCHGPRVSFDPSGHGSGECCSCAAGAMLSPWRAGSGSGGCQTPWTVFLPYRLDGFPWSNFFYDRQGSPFRRSCRRPRLADTSVIMGVHIQKSTKSNWVPYGPQSVFLCLYFCVYSIFARDCCFTIRFLANFVSLKWLSPIMVLGLSCGQRGADCPLVTFLPPYKCSALKCSALNTVSVYRMARSL